MILDKKAAIDRYIIKYRAHILSAIAAVLLYTLLGFFLVPWLVNKIAVESVNESLDARLAIGNVEFNPFTFRLRIEELDLENISEDPVLRVGEVVVNFQLSSLFRWAWTFDEVHLNNPEFYLARDSSGGMNVAELIRPTPETIESPAVVESGPSQLVRLLILDFVVSESVVHWNDQVPPEAVSTRFGPINISIQGLSTLPQRAGQQAVVITTETTGTLSWEGSLQLNPFNSAGHASIQGSHFPLTSAYLRHQTGFEVIEGLAYVAFDYNVSTEESGSLKAAIDNFNLEFEDVLVRTYSPQATLDSPDRDVISLPAIALTGGTLRWPEQSVSIDSLSIDDAVLDLYRNTSGQLNIIPAKAEISSASAPVIPDDSMASTVKSNKQWDVTLGELSVGNMAAILEDDRVDPSATIGLESLNLSIKEISNRAGAAFPTSLRIVPLAGGLISLDGEVSVLPDLVLGFDVNIDALELAGAHPYMKSLADVNFDSGALNLNGSLRSSPDESLSLVGSLAVVDFLITETDAGSRLGSWSRFDVKNFEFSVDSKSLAISEIELQQPYGDILIASDGSVNIGRIQKEDGAEPSDTAITVEPEEISSAEAGGFEVTIGRIEIVDAAADFTDESLPLPFSAKIANLNGDISTIATSSSEPSTVALEGSVDEFGLVRVSGFLTPFETSRNTDLNVAFQNVDVPKFSAYTIQFAGREIANGKLDLDLSYKVTASELVGENSIVFRDLELGEKVPHPGALSLPLGLAVALLKDPAGKIDIDLPIRGNVDDPEFRYGGVVLKALGTLIVKIVASPFALLGNLLGVEADELEYFAFFYGRSDLTPPELEKAGKIAQALIMRPALVLEIRGAVDRDRDGIALRTARLDATLAERISVLEESDSDQAMFAENQKKVLEQLFTELYASADAATTLAALETQYTTAASQEDEGGPVLFDELAYTTEIRRLLIEIQTLGEEEFVALANQRASNTREAVVGREPALNGRVLLGQPQAVADESAGAIHMKVTLSAGNESSGEAEVGSGTN